MDQEKIGRFISELRKEKGLTQDGLAELFYVTRKSVSRWENGKTLPDVSILKDLARLFDVSLEELLDGQRIEKKEKSPWQIFGFYVFVSFTGVFVLPILGLVAPLFIFMGILCPIATLLKVIFELCGWDLPYVSLQIGSFVAPSFVSFLVSIPIGLLLYILGIKAWSLLLKYIRYIGSKFREFSGN